MAAPRHAAPLDPRSRIFAPNLRSEMNHVNSFQTASVDHRSQMGMTPSDRSASQASQMGYQGIPSVDRHSISQASQLGEPSDHSYWSNSAPATHRSQVSSKISQTMGSQVGSEVGSYDWVEEDPSVQSAQCDVREGFGICASNRFCV